MLFRQVAVLLFSLTAAIGFWGLEWMEKSDRKELKNGTKPQNLWLVVALWNQATIQAENHGTLVQAFALKGT